MAHPGQAASREHEGGNSAPRAGRLQAGSSCRHRKPSLSAWSLLEADPAQRLTAVTARCITAQAPPHSWGGGAARRRRGRVQRGRVNDRAENQGVGYQAGALGADDTEWLVAV